MPAKHFFYLYSMVSYTVLLYTFICLLIYFNIILFLFICCWFVCNCCRVFGVDIFAFCYFVLVLLLSRLCSAGVCVFVYVCIFNHLRLTYKYVLHNLYLFYTLSDNSVYVYGFWLSNSFNSLIYGFVFAIHY